MDSIKKPEFTLTLSVARAIALLSLVVGLAGCDVFTSPETRIQRAEAQMRDREFRGASIELKNALQDQPENGHARRLLAEVSLYLGDAPGADAELRRAVDFGEPPAAVGDLAARIRLALGQYDALLTAIDAGEYVLGVPSRTVFRGKALLGLQRHAEALAQFEEALTADPQSTDAGVGSAEALAGLGRYDAALARLQAVTERQPGLAVAWLVRGRLLAGRGQFDAALESLETARRVDSGQLSAEQQAMLLGTLIEARISRGEVPAAEAAYQELVRVVPGAPVTRFMGARIALVKQDFAGAATELQRLVSSSPGFTTARFLLGAVSLAQGRLQQADLHLAQVVQSSPENTEARKLLAQVRMRLDRPDEAVQVLLPALEGGQLDVQVSSLLGASQLQSARTGQQRAVLEKALMESPDSTQLLLDLAATCLREGDARRALELLGKPAARRGGILRDALNLAALAAAQGSAAADAELNRLLRERPEDVDMLNLAAGLLTQRAEFDRGRALLVKALGIAPDNASTLLGMARLEVAAGNLAIAEGQLEKLISLDARNSMAHIGLADVALRRGDRAGAIRRIEAWRTSDPDELAARYRLARLYLMDNQAAAAGKVIDEAIAVSPDPAQGANIAGSIYLDLGRYEQAVASFRDAAERDPEQPAYWLNLAQAQLALDERGAARESIGRALRLRSDWVAAVGIAALLDLRDGMPESAIARVRRLKQSRPRDATVLMLEGDIYLSTRQYLEAAKAFDEGFSLRPESVAAVKSYRARLQGRLGEVTDPLTRWLAQKPDDFAVRSILAEAYQLAGQQQRAIQEYESVVRDGPPNAVALNNLAWLYQLRGDRRALDAGLRARNLAPNAAPVADTYGWILFQNGKAAEALPLLEQAAKALPDAPEVQFHFAAALAKVGRTAEARNMLSALLAKQMTFDSREDARRLLAELNGK